MSEPIYLPDGRIAGVVRGTVFVKHAWASRHLLRQPPAWAVDADVLAELEARAVRRVIVREQESGSAYEADLTAFRRHGMRFDRGHGAQIALPLAYWRKDGAPSDYERQAEREALRTAQLQLFGVEGRL